METEEHEGLIMICSEFSFIMRKDNGFPRALAPFPGFLQEFRRQLIYRVLIHRIKSFFKVVVGAKLRIPFPKEISHPKLDSLLELGMYVISFFVLEID
jgi:hypothetical protein